jgi:hypothetical protein
MTKMGMSAYHPIAAFRPTQMNDRYRPEAASSIIVTPDLIRGRA